jgi:hypothetical protein
MISSLYVQHSTGNKKPQVGYMVDRQHPAGQSLCFYTAFQEISRLVGPNPGNFNTPDNVDGNIIVDIAGGFKMNVRGPAAGLYNRVGIRSRTGPTISFIGAQLNRTPGIICSQNPPGIAAIKGPFTAGLKFSTTTSGQAMPMFGNCGLTGQGLFGFQIGSSNTMSFIFNTNGPGPPRALSVNTYNDGNFYTAFGVWTGGDVRLYMFSETGALLEQITGTVISAFDSGVTVTPLAISCVYDSTTTGTMYNGYMEWCGVWRQVLPVGRMGEIASQPYGFLIPTSRTPFPGGSLKTLTTISHRTRQG